MVKSQRSIHSSFRRLLALWDHVHAAVNRDHQSYIFILPNESHSIEVSLAHHIFGLIHHLSLSVSRPFSEVKTQTERQGYMKDVSIRASLLAHCLHTILLLCWIMPVMASQIGSNFDFRPSRPLDAPANVRHNISYVLCPPLSPYPPLLLFPLREWTHRPTQGEYIGLFLCGWVYMRHNRQNLTWPWRGCSL